MTWLVDHFTDYRSRYHYPRRWAVVAEICWRLEHSPIRRVGKFYLWRKRAEHYGYEARTR